MNNVNRFMYDHSLLLFTCFHFKKDLKGYIKDCFKIDGKQTIKISKKNEYVKFNNFERKTKSPFMIYVDFGSVLVPEYNGEQN